MRKRLQFNHLQKTRIVSKELSNKYIKKLPLHLKENGHQSKGMKVFFMANVIHVMNMVTDIRNIDIMKGDIIEHFITPQGVEDVIK
jgi:hypothetical protein